MMTLVHLHHFFISMLFIKWAFWFMASFFSFFLFKPSVSCHLSSRTIFVLVLLVLFTCWIVFISLLSLSFEYHLCRHSLSHTLFYIRSMMITILVCLFLIYHNERTNEWWWWWPCTIVHFHLEVPDIFFYLYTPVQDWCNV